MVRLDDSRSPHVRKSAKVHSVCTCLELSARDQQTWQACIADKSRTRANSTRVTQEGWRYQTKRAVFCEHVGTSAINQPSRSGRGRSPKNGGETQRGTIGGERGKPISQTLCTAHVHLAHKGVSGTVTKGVSCSTGEINCFIHSGTTRVQHSARVGVTVLALGAQVLCQGSDDSCGPSFVSW